MPEPSWPAAAKAQAAVARAQNCASLQPLAGRRDGTNATPAAADDRHEQEDQHSPPGDPNEDDGEVAVAHRSAEKTGHDRQHESGERRDRHQKLRPATAQQTFDQGRAGEVHASHFHLTMNSAAAPISAIPAARQNNSPPPTLSLPLMNG